MPAENSEPRPQEQPHDDWKQLAHDARGWDLEHPGVAALYENHVVPKLHDKGLGHLAISTAEQAGNSSPDGQDSAPSPESRPTRTRITVEQAGGDPADIRVVLGAGVQQLRPERTSTNNNTPNTEGAPEDAVQRLESERKRNVNENLRVLQKRFGERFVKGDLMEGGGYTGGAARELLAGFMDRPGFADELKRIIPSKYGALALLKDNHAYIQTTLEQRYKDDPTRERVPAKDPYELARSVGYELTGPFKATSEFMPYRHDFREDERICTYNNPTKRLEEYHMLWLRHTEVADTLPADELTADNLSPSWKTYLKTIGRYDRDTDSYNLVGLHATRDDPYGTSSMSVQISRQGTHVSIKNRYNHTVGNPDNTLDSDLDNVAYGLKRAVYASVGREDLMDKTSVTLAEGYCADNDGGIHAYKYEEDNVYYGDYEYISNGVVTAIDRGKYLMISPQLYVPIGQKGEDIRLGQRAQGNAGLAASTDVQFLYKSNANGNEKDPRILELRRAYAERDHAELKALVVERIRDSFEASYQGYDAVANQLEGAAHLSKAEVEQLFQAELEEWEQSGVLDYATERLITHGELHMPVFTPNVVATVQELKAIANNFAKGQGFNEAYIYDPMYDAITDDELAQLSGYDPTAGPIRIALMANKPNIVLGTVQRQRDELASLQVAATQLKYRAPGLVDGLSEWYTLRARGDTLKTGDAWGRTVVRKFDMEPKRFGGGLCVPGLGVGAGGGPDVDCSVAGLDGAARVLVG